MTEVAVKPGFRSGMVIAPPSKSLAHRALICAALCENNNSNVVNIDLSQDISATVEALKVLKNGGEVINCGESGSTLRFIMPVAAALGVSATFTGEGGLPERPIDIYKDLFFDKGVRLELNKGGLPAKISGKLQSGKYYVPGNVSSQFITGLMFALPLLDGGSDVILTSPLESEPYVDMTIDVLNAFGVTVERIDRKLDIVDMLVNLADVLVSKTGITEKGYAVKGGQKYKSADFKIEGDYSQAAFFACAAAINGDIKICGLNPVSSQGDFKFIEILRKFGAAVDFHGDILHVKKCENLRGIKIDGAQIPDLVPVLAVVAAYAQGRSVINNAGRLRLKESDRLRAVCEMLTAIGADAKETRDGLIINGGKKLRGGFARSFNDHRVAMSAAVAAVGTEDGVTIDDMACINKSYPGFLRDFEKL